LLQLHVTIDINVTRNRIAMAAAAVPKTATGPAMAESHCKEKPRSCIDGRMPHLLQSQCDAEAAAEILGVSLQYQGGVATGSSRFRCS
jgi:hypothetical protein